MAKFDEEAERRKMENLPPIIIDVIVTLLNDKTPKHVRENACARLENIGAACNRALEMYAKEGMKYTNLRSKQRV